MEDENKIEELTDKLNTVNKELEETKTKLLEKEKVENELTELKEKYTKLKDINAELVIERSKNLVNVNNGSNEVKDETKELFEKLEKQYFNEESK